MFLAFEKQPLQKITIGTLIGFLFVLLLSVFPASNAVQLLWGQQQCQHFYVSGPVWYWTPLVLGNSPYGGSATVSTSQPETTGFNFLGITSNTQSQSATSLMDNNGAAAGDFQLDAWDMYYANQYCSPSGYYAVIVQTSNNECAANLLLSGSKQDTGEPTTISCTYGSVTYSSISFQNNFVSTSATLNYCNSGSQISKTTGTTTLQGSDLTVSVGSYVSASGTATLTSSATQTFTYYFYTGSGNTNGIWCIYYLGKDSGLTQTNGAWAFETGTC